jgi:hypothetical protein
MNAISVGDVNKNHDRAMEYAGLGLLARQSGNNVEAQRLFRQAFELEREVAHQLAETNIEPSRSIIHRSAATLALDCGEIREAEKLIATALAGEPPKQIAAELRDLLMEVVPVLQGSLGN